MDSTTLLDYVLFQLTPTRTRCELIIFAGKSKEKLAYGLLDPFIAHLRSAKDQISKGGYSITLRPPPSLNSNWFTKGTVLRFVRFVSTPEVLERFETIEREISQLENSIKSYEAANTPDDEGYSKDSVASFKSKEESNESSDQTQEENSKVRLQRVLETRKAVLRKEQAMVYARALAAGYEMDNLQDLLSFSDAFGASRLREACINFKELCKKKNEDRVWVDEIAAMRAMVQPELAYMATSGIILAGEENDQLNSGKPNGSTDMSLSDSMTSHGSSDANPDFQNPSTDAKAQMANPWAQNFAPYLRNFQGPMYQQMPPYQGYGFTGMPPPYYPPNMPWPSDLNGSADHGSHDRRDRRSSSRKKGKSSNARGSEKEDLEEHTNSSASSSETDSSSEKSHKKKSGKKSSRKVVIRNINYITSKRDGEKDGSSETNSSDEDEYLNGGSLKQQLEEAVGSFEKHNKKSSSHHKKRNGSKHLGPPDKDDDGNSNKNGNKGNENWDALQQLLLKEESDPEPHSMSVDESIFAGEKSYTQNSSAFKGEEEGIAKSKPIATDAFLVTEKGRGDDGKISSGQGFDFDPSESTIPISRRGSIPDEFLFSHRNEEPDGYSHMSLSVDASRSAFRSQTSDDWIIGKQSDIGANRGGNDRIGFIEGDYVRSTSNHKTKDVIIDDSLMIQGRLMDDHPESRLTTDVSLVSDIVEATLIENGTGLSHQKSEPGGFYEPDELYMVRDHDAVVEPTIPSWNPELDYETFSSVNVSVQKSDVDASEESKVESNEKGSNKKSGKTPSRDPRSRTVGGPLRRTKPEPTPGTRRSTFGSKTTNPKSQLEKKQEEERRKRMEELLIQRQKRIAERSSITKAATPSPDKSKPKTVLRSSTIERLATAKTSPKPSTTQPKKESPKMKSPNTNSGLQKTNSADSKKIIADLSKPLEKKSGLTNINRVSLPISDVKEVDDQKDIKELHVTSPNTNNNKDVKVVVSEMEISNEKVGKPLEDHPTTLDSIKEKFDIISKEFMSFQNEGKVSDDRHKSGPELSVHPLPESPPKQLDSDLKVEETADKVNDSPDFTEISEIEESTPPPLTKELGVDNIQMRKKWDGAENSPKTAKGFRKLLMFGRRS